MVSVPVSEKLPAVVKVAPFASVSLPVLAAKPARALVLLEVFSIVPRASVRLAALVVIAWAAPVMLRFVSST